MTPSRAASQAILNAFSTTSLDRRKRLKRPSGPLLVLIRVKFFAAGPGMIAKMRLSMVEGERYGRLVFVEDLGLDEDNHSIERFACD